MTQGIGYGCKLSYANGSGSASGDIGSIVDGWESESEVEMVDVSILTTFDNLYLPAGREPGEVTFEVALSDSSDLAVLQEAQTSGRMLTFTATYSNGTTARNFNGFVKTIGEKVAKKELLTSKIVIKKTGAPL